VEINIPWLLTAYNSPAAFEFEARIVIVVPLGSGRPCEIAFHFSSSSDLLYTNDSASSM
jgi:hypothetical protein